MEVTGVVEDEDLPPIQGEEIILEGEPNEANEKEEKPVDGVRMTTPWLGWIIAVTLIAMTCRKVKI